MFLTAQIAITLLIITLVIVVLIRFAHEKIEDISERYHFVVGAMGLITALSVMIALIDLIWFY